VQKANNDLMETRLHLERQGKDTQKKLDGLGKSQSAILDKDR